jgi:regulator of sigma E protease
VTQGDAALTPKTWDDLLAVFAQAGGKPVPLVVRRGETTQTALVTAARKPVERFTLLSSQPAGPFYEDLPRIYNPATAVARGMKQTWTWLGRIYINLLQLVRGEVSTRSVGGPVLIVQSSLGIATRGVGTFIHFWGILSICVAVFNFLPVPPFDGGQVVFILAEKLKGGPISLRVRTWVWGASWVAVLALFVLVTWQDIARLL